MKYLISLATTLFLVNTLFSECVIEFEPTYQAIVDSALELKSADAEVAASHAAKWQAGLYPNPDLTVSVDDMENCTRGDHDGECFVGVTQLFELGGKRSARVEVAEAEQCVISWNRELLKNELFGKVLHVFVAIATAQERLQLYQEQQNLAEQVLSSMTNKAALGKASSMEMKRAEVAYRSIKLLLSKQQAALSSAKKQLYTLWDCSGAPNFDRVNFPLYELAPLPCFQFLCDALSCHPELAKAQAEVILATKTYYYERAQRIPDMALQVGVTTERFTRHPTLGFQIDIPLPIFDRNQGNICRARNVQDQAIYNQMDVACHLRSEFVVLYDQWQNAYEQALELKDQMLPAAIESFQMARQGYEEGKFNYIDLRDAKNTLFEIQLQYLDAVEDYHHKRADVLKNCSAIYQPLVEQSLINCNQ